MNVSIMNAWQILFKGGPMMWPILLLSIAGCAIGINRLITLSKTEKRLLVEKQILLESLRHGQLKDKPFIRAREREAVQQLPT